MKLERVLLEQLEADRTLAGLVGAARVRLECKRRPGRVDRARGAARDQQAYFWGVPFEAAADEGLEARAGGGLVVLFQANIRPLTGERVATVLLHELGHVFGLDELELVEGMALC